MPSPLARLREVKWAIDALLDNGETQQGIEYLLESLAELPKKHSRLAAETVSQQRRRLKKLAGRFRTLASVVERDPDGTVLSVLYIESIRDTYRIGLLNGRASNRPTLSALLRDIALHVEETSPLSGTVTRKLPLRGFVIRECLDHLKLFSVPGRGKNKMAAAFATAVLGQNVKPNDVTQANINRRRKYNTQQ